MWPGKGAATAVLFTDRKATELSAVQITMSSGNRLAPAVGNGVGAPEPMSPLAIRVHGEYREMPALRLTCVRLLDCSAWAPMRPTPCSTSCDGRQSWRALSIEQRARCRRKAEGEKRQRDPESNTLRIALTDRALS